MTSAPLLSTPTGAQLPGLSPISAGPAQKELLKVGGKHGCEERGKRTRWSKNKRGKQEEMRNGGKVGGMNGRGHRHALLPLNWSLNTGHKTRLAPYTSSLHVKGRLHCLGLTAHLTCLDWKKGDISLPVSPLTASRLNKPISWTFLLQRRLFYTSAKLWTIGSRTFHL